MRPPEPPLRDRDLLLRPSRPGDEDAIGRVYSDPDVVRWMGFPEGADAAFARGNMERAERAWQEGTWAPFRIVDASSDEVVGGVNLRFGEHRIAEVSYFLRADARGRGLATRALRLVARWAFEELGIKRLELRAHVDNAPSQRVAERAGFTREGIERASRELAGVRFDSVLYSLLPSEV